MRCSNLNDMDTVQKDTSWSHLHTPHTEHYIKSIPPIKQKQKPSPLPPHSVSCKTRAHLYVCTLINAWLVEEKHHQCKLQWVAAGWLQVMCAPGHQQEQDAATNFSLYKDTNPNQTLPLCYLNLVLTLCNLHWWWFSCHQLAQKSHLHLLYLQLVLVVFFLCQLAHCLRCTHDLHPSCCYPLQFALVVFFLWCDGGVNK